MIFRDKQSIESDGAAELPGGIQAAVSGGGLRAQYFGVHACPAAWDQCQHVVHLAPQVSCGPAGDDTF